MGDLTDLFDEMAAAPAPPARLIAADLFAAGRRRYRRIRAAQSAAGLALTVVALAGVVFLAPPSHTHRQTPVVAPGSSAVVPPGRAQPAQMVVAANATHLYAAQRTCADGSCKLRVQLTGSADGGRTWSRRGGPIDLSAFEAAGSGTLLGAESDGSSQTLTISRDGGRGWAPVRDVQAPAAEIPAGGLVVCRVPAAGDCVLRFVDPVAGTAARPARPPALTVAPLAAGLGAATTVPGHPRMWWLTGFDPVSGEPATALSSNGGGSWEVHTFTGTGCGSGCRAPQVAVGADTTAYVTVGARVYRYADGIFSGAGSPAAGGDGQIAWSFVTTDGTHVVALDAPGGWGFVAAAGGGYHQFQPAGLPERTEPVRRTGDGWFYTVDAATGRWFGSADGRQWTVLTR